MLRTQTGARQCRSGAAAVYLVVVLRWMIPLKMPALGAGPPGREVRVPGSPADLPARATAPAESLGVAIQNLESTQLTKWLEPAFTSKFSDLTVESTELPRGMLSGWPLWRRHRRDSEGTTSPGGMKKFG
jgi:hypothetical protein